MLVSLALLDTPAFWRLVQHGVENEGTLLLAALNEKRQQQGLSEAEESLVRALIPRHDRAVLIRAKALALLHQRGEHVRAEMAWVRFKDLRGRTGPAGVPPP
jgi:hypothetical protein